MSVFNVHIVGRNGATIVNRQISAKVDLSNFEACLASLEAFAQGHNLQRCAGIVSDAEGDGYAWADPLALVAVYYATQHQCVTAAMQPEVLLNNIESKALKWPFIQQFLIGEESVSSTGYQGLYRVRPSSYIKLGAYDEPPELKRYWVPTINNHPEVSSLPEFCQRFSTLFTEYLHQTLQHVQKPAVNISGGLDSALIAVYVTKACKELGLPAPIALTWMSAPDESNSQHIEHRLVKSLSEQLGLQLEYCPVSSQHLIASMQEDVLAYGSSVMSHELAVIEQAKSLGIDYIFSGWGGDQCLSYKGAGYLPGLLRQGKWYEWLMSVLYHSPSLTMSLMSIPRSFFGNWWRPFDKKRIGKNAYIDFTNRLFEPVEPDSSKDYLNHFEFQLYQCFADGHLQDRVQSQARWAKASGACYDYPLLYPEVVEYMLNMPSQFIYHQRQSRAFIRELLRGKVDEQLRLCAKLSDVMRSQDLDQALLSVFQQVAQLEQHGYQPPPPYNDIVKWHDLLNVVKQSQQHGVTASRGLGRMFRVFQVLQLGLTLKQQ